MPTYNSLISRDVSSDPLVPTPVSNQIIQELPQFSAVMNLAKQMKMSSLTQRQPVLDVLPEAYFVSGDSGRKQTSTADWKNVELVAEELASIILIPDAYFDDAQVPLWDEIRPRLVEAIGAKIDAACLFGTNKPSTWGTAIYTGAVAAGNVVVAGAGSTDLAQNVAFIGEEITKDGFSLNGFASRPGLLWKLIQMRSATDKLPIYEPDLQSGRGGNLYGYPLREVLNSAWDTSEAELIAGDWSKAILGMRQDVSFKLFDQGVISDDSGVVVHNLMQQDAKALRVVIRVAWAVANPVTRLNTSSSTRFPFGVVQATTANS